MSLAEYSHDEIEHITACVPKHESSRETLLSLALTSFHLFSQA